MEQCCLRDRKNLIPSNLLLNKLIIDLLLKENSVLLTGEFLVMNTQNILTRIINLEPANACGMNLPGSTENVTRAM